MFKQWHFDLFVLVMLGTFLMYLVALFLNWDIPEAPRVVIGVYGAIVGVVTGSNKEMWSRLFKKEKGVEPGA
jgi:hypothetical protein